MNIEPLEARIAPAVLVNPADHKIATFTDIDGDLVTIKVSIGDLTTAGLISLGAGLGDQLQLINLSNGGFDDANVSITVKKAATGDGLVNVGRINSAGHDLGVVSVQGDLGVIDAGDSTTLNDPGIKSLAVRSMGRFFTSTGAPADLESDIMGDIGSLTVKGDIHDAYIRVTAGGIGSINITGSLLGLRAGTAADRPGAIETDNDIGAVKIGRDIVGSGFASGFIQSDYGKIKSVTLGGSLVGGPGQYSGQIRSGSDMGPVKIGGNVVGGTGPNSGVIASDSGFGVDDGNIASITIAGSLLGGTGDGSGVIRSPADVGSIKIGNNVTGNTGNEAGKIDILGNLASLAIGGSVLGSTGKFDTSGHASQIYVRGTAGSVNVAGSLLGGIDPDITDFVYPGSGSGSLQVGGAKSIKIGHDVIGGSAISSGSINASTGKLTSVVIGGSLVGGSQQSSGNIFADTIVMAKVGGDVRGGVGRFSGRITSDKTVTGGIAIGGSLLGGNGESSGTIQVSSAASSIKIGHDILGGAGVNSGSIGTTFLTPVPVVVSVGGSIIGGSASGTGCISLANIGKLTIGHDLVGSSISGSMPGIGGAGAIRVFGSLGSVSIGGSIISGVDASTGGDLSFSGGILVGDDLGSLAVKGSLIGHPDTGTGASFVTIGARGQNAMSSKLTATSDVAIGKITIGGHVEFAKILAGYDYFQLAKNADAQIGAVKVGGDWVASSIVAGATNAGNPKFGDGNDVKISGGGVKDTDDATLVSRIASITISGIVAGTTINTDHYGFVAQRIGSFKSLGFTTNLQPSGAPDIIYLLPATQNDVTIREI